MSSGGRHSQAWGSRLTLRRPHTHSFLFAFPSAARFDECIVEGIAFNEPLITDVPPRVPAGYVPLSKHSLLAGTSTAAAASAAATDAAAAAAYAAMLAQVRWTMGGEGVAEQAEHVPRHTRTPLMRTSQAAKGSGAGGGEDEIGDAGGAGRTGPAGVAEALGLLPSSSPAYDSETAEGRGAGDAPLEGLPPPVDGSASSALVPWDPYAAAPRGRPRPRPGLPVPRLSAAGAPVGGGALALMAVALPAAPLWSLPPGSLVWADVSDSALAAAAAAQAPSPEDGRRAAVSLSDCAGRGAWGSLVRVIRSRPDTQAVAGDGSSLRRPLLAVLRVSLLPGGCGGAPVAVDITVPAALVFLPLSVLGAPLFEPAGVAQGCGLAVGGLRALAVTLHRGIATRAARACVASLLAAWPPSLPLTTALLGGPSAMIALAKLATAEEGVLGAAMGLRSARAAAEAASNDGSSGGGGAEAAGGSAVTDSLRRLMVDVVASEVAAGAGGGKAAAALSAWLCTRCTAVNDPAAAAPGGEPTWAASGAACYLCRADRSAVQQQLQMGPQQQQPLRAGAAAAAASAPLSADGTLASGLVADCLWSLTAAGSACVAAGALAVTKGSVHPLADMPAEVEVGTVTVAPSAGSTLWVTFDPRCETDPADATSYVAFYAAPLVGAPVGSSSGGSGAGGGAGGDAPSSQQQPVSTAVQSARSVGAAFASGLLRPGAVCVARFSGPSPAFTPFLVQASVLQWVVVRGNARRAGPAAAASYAQNGGWGLQFCVTPFRSMAWGSEADVGAQPSLLWGLWLLDFLLSGALPHALLLRGVVHNGRMITALVDYLRTAGAPHKDLVVGLLAKLLASPEYLLVTPLHADYEALGTARAVATLSRASAVPTQGTREEGELLTRFVALPLRLFEAVRLLAAVKAEEALRASLLFLPSPLQRLQELISLADAAVRRARAHMHVLACSEGRLYAGPSYAASAQAAGAPLPLSAHALAVPAAMMPVGRLLLSQSGRCDAMVPGLISPPGSGVLAKPYFDAAAPRWLPTLLVNVPDAEPQLKPLPAMIHLREVLLTVATGRRLPDAWMCRAVMRAQGLPDVAALTPELLRSAHLASARFTSAADEAVGAWMAAYASRHGGDALTVEPAQLELRDADRDAFPALAPYSLLELRLRASVIRIVNALLARCINEIDMDTSGGAGAAAASGAQGAAGGSGRLSIATDAVAADAAAAPGTPAAAAARVASSPAAAASAAGVDPAFAPGFGVVYGPHVALSTLPLGALVRRLPHLFLVDAKERLIADAIERSTTPGASGLKVIIDNRAALASLERGLHDPASSLCVFAQVRREGEGGGASGSTPASHPLPPLSPPRRSSATSSSSASTTASCAASSLTASCCGRCRTSVWAARRRRAWTGAASTATASSAPCSTCSRRPRRRSTSSCRQGGGGGTKEGGAPA